MVLESLLSAYARPQVMYFNYGVASFDLVHRFQEYDTVLLIDGINATLAPGELKIFALQDIESFAAENIISTHELNLKTIFELSKKFALKTAIFVAGIQVQEVGFGQGLSAPLQGALGKNVAQVRDYIDSLISR